MATMSTKTHSPNNRQIKKVFYVFLIPTCIPYIFNNEFLVGCSIQIYILVVVHFFNSNETKFFVLCSIVSCASLIFLSNAQHRHKQQQQQNINKRKKCVRICACVCGGLLGWLWLRLRGFAIALLFFSSMLQQPVTSIRIEEKMKMKKKYPYLHHNQPYRIVSTKGANMFVLLIGN